MRVALEALEPRAFALDNQSVEAFPDLDMSVAGLRERDSGGVTRGPETENVGLDQLREQALQLRVRNFVAGPVVQRTGPAACRASFDP